jgi:hypothetical protein
MHALAIQQIRIDSLDFHNVCLVKIDVEGMEESVLNGCFRTLERTRPIVLVEYLKSDAGKLADVMRRLDYAVYVYSGDFLCIPKRTTVPLNVDLPEYADGMTLENIINQQG